MGKVPIPSPPAGRRDNFKDIRPGWRPTDWGPPFMREKDSF
jgi:hypothetical protein